MDFSADQIMVYAMMACFMIMIFLTRHDAYKSVSRMGEILHEAQEDAKLREEGIWNRANVELEVKNRQLQEAHKFVMRAKVPIAQAQAQFPFQESAGNGQRQRQPTPSRRGGLPDQATLG